MRDDWVRGRTEITVTFLPNQEIIAEMGDEVIVHVDKPESAGKRCYGAGGVVQEGDAETAPWRVGDTASY